MKWDSTQYWLKSRVYQAKAVDGNRDASERLFWRALALEHLLRAALTKVHPALNADPQSEGAHLMYAFGFPTKGEPRSIPIHAVTARLEHIIPEFKRPHREICDYLMLMRNEEVHTSTLPFEGLKESAWLPRYYEACRILHDFIGVPLDQYLDEKEAKTASELIDAMHSKKRGIIEKRVVQCRDEFMKKSDDERAVLVSAQHAATAGWAYPAIDTPCPACGCDAFLSGTLERTSDPMLQDDALVTEETYLARVLNCGACGLQLEDVEELHWAEVNPHYSHTVHTDLHEFLEPDDVGFYMNM